MQAAVRCNWGEFMRIGVPEALLFQRYEPFIRAFFDGLPVETVYSGPSNRNILERGIRDCVDEACLPMKVFQGHVSRLLEECDRVAVPRLMKCEYGDSICPKFAGLPELIGKGKEKNRFLFTEPLYLNNRARLKKAVIGQAKQLDLPQKRVLSAFRAAEDLIRNESQPYGLPEETVETEKCRVALLGHPYNVYDSFVNMNLIRKLKTLGVGVITGEKLAREKSDAQTIGLMKAPYWLFYRENLGNARTLREQGAVDGIVYVSSFCCGTDSVTIEMIKSRIGDFPMLVLKLDEHTAEAGLDTRLEAFVELLERRRCRSAMRQPATGTDPLSGKPDKGSVPMAVTD